MRIDIDDPRIHATITTRPGTTRAGMRLRLTIDYPYEPKYCKHVLFAIEALQKKVVPDQPSSETKKPTS